MDCTGREGRDLGMASFFVVFVCLVGMSNSSKWNSHLLNGQGGVL